MNKYFNYFVYVVLNTFNFKGRAGLTEYWSYFATCLPFVLFTYFGLDSLSLNEVLMFLGAFLIWCIPTIALTIRRLHDVNFSGWYFILCVCFTPFSLYIACKDSYSKENKWGENPKNKPEKVEINPKKLKIVGGILGIILILIASISLFNLVVGDKYACNNSEATELVLENFKKDIEEVIKNQFYNERINYKDISEYARENGLDYFDVIRQEEKKLDYDLDKHKEKIFESITLQNILTSSINKEIKKCECEGTIIYGDKQKNVIYSVQENTDGEIYVEYLKEDYYGF